LLVEKFPENCFRLRFLNRIFPDARYVYIFRSGVEVARSIAEAAERGKWFGVDDYKWRQIVSYARSRKETADLPELCVTNFRKGLLEWRLSREAVRDFFRMIPGESVLPLTYDRLVDAPLETMNRVLSFLDLDESPEVEKFVSEKIKRRSPKAVDVKLEPEEEHIAGAD